MVTIGLVMLLGVIVTIDVVWHAKRLYPDASHPVVAWWRVEAEGRHPTSRERAMHDRVEKAHAEGLVVLVHTATFNH